MEYSHLPHIDIKDYYQFVTFRTHDSLDEYLKKLLTESGVNRKKQLEIDKYLDHSPGGAYLNDQILFALFDSLKSQDGKLYDLAAFCIMPNHVHLLMKPLLKLPVVMNRVKGNTAKLINHHMNRKGSFWAPDYFDRLIRDERHFRLVYRYIRNNPL